MGRARAAAFTASAFTNIGDNFDLRRLFPNIPPDEEQTPEKIIQAMESWPELQ